MGSCGPDSYNGAITMPAVHIPEKVFSDLVEQEGGYSEAKQAVKDAAQERVE